MLWRVTDKEINEAYLLLQLAELSLWELYATAFGVDSSWGGSVDVSERLRTLRVNITERKKRNREYKREHTRKQGKEKIKQL